MKRFLSLSRKRGWGEVVLLRAAILLFGFVAASAQQATNTPANAVFATNPPARLSLADARRIALERNWDLLAAKSGIDAAQAQLIVAREFPNPTASLSTANIGDRESATLMGNGLWERNYDSIAAINQLIEIGGKRRSRQTSARAGIMGARARFFDAKRSLEQGVTKAYMAAVLAGQNAGILNESAGYLLHEAEIAEARLKAGDISDSDKNQIEINAEQFELQAKAAEAAAVQARIAVEILLGERQPRGNWTPTESLDQLVNASPPPAIEGASNAGRPDVLAAEADLRKSNADLKLQKAMRIPDPTVSIQGEHNPPGGGYPPEGGPTVDTVGVGVSFPLPLWNRNRGNIKAAEAAREQAVIALEKAKAQVISDIANAEVAYREAFERWQKYRDQTGPKAAKVRESVAYAYEKGGAALVELLEAERTANDVELATAQAMADTANAAADLVAARSELSERELTSQK
jgi:cobalt-zinc-cadmium efflux system outer membrane protein